MPALNTLVFIFIQLKCGANSRKCYYNNSVINKNLLEDDPLSVQSNRQFDYAKGDLAI